MGPKRIKNSVPPCPWKSRAILGYPHLCKKPQTPFGPDKLVIDILNIDNKEYSHRTQSLFKQSTFLKNLNKNTLILSFPQFHPDQIEAALSLCDNDLSEAISLLRLRTHVIKEKALILEQRSRNKAVNKPLVKNNDVTYIPTKYNDVQIVEFCGKTSSQQVPAIATAEVAKEMKTTSDSSYYLKTSLSQTSATTISSYCYANTTVGTVTTSLPTIRPTNIMPVCIPVNNSAIAKGNNLSVEKQYKDKVDSLFSSIPPSYEDKLLNNHIQTISKAVSTSSDLERSPAAASISSGVFSEDFDKYKIYDFAEDESVLADSSPKSTSERVGIILKKTSDGFTASVL